MLEFWRLYPTRCEQWEVSSGRGFDCTNLRAMCALVGMNSEPLFAFTSLCPHVLCSFVVDEDTVGEGFFSSISCSGSEEYLLDCKQVQVDPTVCRLPYDTVGVQCREFLCLCFVNKCIQVFLPRLLSHYFQVHPLFLAKPA